MQNAKITIIQPFIPNYREDFYKKLSFEMPFDLLTVEKPLSNLSFKLSKKVKSKNIKILKLGSIIIFNPFNYYIIKNKTIVIQWNPKWFSLFILLIVKPVLKKKIILWTHGVSVRNGFSYDRIKDKIKLFFFNLSDGLLFYTENELNIMSPFLKKPKLYFLNNSINIDKIFKKVSLLDIGKDKIKKKYNISASRIIIYCARFIQDRRSDLLIELIEKMRNDDVIFLIIGDGPFKPEFSHYTHVKDYGAMYDEEKKAELFSISDFTFQPAWSGLSVVESFAHGVPYITLEKRKDILQCVEYNYIVHGSNGFILKDLNSVQAKVTNLPKSKINEMKKNCTEYVKSNLSLNQMVNKFVHAVKSL